MTFYFLFWPQNFWSYFSRYIDFIIFLGFQKNSACYLKLHQFQVYVLIYTRTKNSPQTQFYDHVKFIHDERQFCSPKFSLLNWYVFYITRAFYKLANMEGSHVRYGSSLIELHIMSDMEVASQNYTLLCFVKMIKK